MHMSLDCPEASAADLHTNQEIEVWHYGHYNAATVLTAASVDSSLGYESCLHAAYKGLTQQCRP